MFRLAAAALLWLSCAMAQNRPEIVPNLGDSDVLPGYNLPTGRECAPGEVFNIGHGVAAPVVVSRVEPKYTDEAKRAKWEGTVVIRGVIDQSGRACGKWTLLRSLGLGLDQRAVDAISQWVFKPGLQNGGPAPVTVTMEVNFHLPRP
jgi:TonB family protein